MYLEFDFADYLCGYSYKSSIEEIVPQLGGGYVENGLYVVHEVVSSNVLLIKCGFELDGIHECRNKKFLIKGSHANICAAINLFVLESVHHFKLKFDLY